MNKQSVFVLLLEWVGYIMGGCCTFYSILNLFWRESTITTRFLFCSVLDNNQIYRMEPPTQSFYDCFFFCFCSVRNLFLLSDVSAMIWNPFWRHATTSTHKMFSIYNLFIYLSLFEYDLIQNKEYRDDIRIFRIYTWAAMCMKRKIIQKQKKIAELRLTTNLNHFLFLSVL